MVWSRADGGVTIYDGGAVTEYPGTGSTDSAIQPANRPNWQQIINQGNTMTDDLAAGPMGGLGSLGFMF